MKKVNWLPKWLGRRDPYPNKGYDEGSDLCVRCRVRRRYHAKANHAFGEEQ